MNNKAIFLMLLLTLPFTKAQGQTITYTYNAKGSCISRVVKGAQPKERKAQEITKDVKLIKVGISPSPTFQDELSVSVSGLPSGQSLSFLMANVSGQIVFNSPIGNGNTTITTTALPKGVYIIKVNEGNFEETYKLLKK